MDIDQLLAKQAITEQLYSYCRAMDRIDAALGTSVWHNDGTADYGDMFHGTGAGFVEWVCGTHRPMIAHSHQVTNILIEIDGQRAASEAYVTAALHYESDAGIVQATVRGRYVDRWSRRGGRWAIDHRIYLHDLDDVRPVSPGMMSRGCRSPSDQSYSVLAAGRS